MATTKRNQAAKRPPKKSKERQINLRFVLPPDLPLLYVDNVQVTHTPTEFVISFMQARPPLLTSEKEWDKILTIESKCVARLVLNPLKMQLLVQALTANFKKFVQNYMEQESASENNNTKTSNGTNARKPV